jgi:hypothetical protein
MAEEALVESLVQDSIRLVDELDKQGDAPTNALWYYFSDAEEWRFLVAGPSFDGLLPRQEIQAYERVAIAISKADFFSLSIGNVKLVRTDDPLLVATKFVVKTAPNGVIRAHFRDNVFNGIFVKEMLVLRAA